MPVIPVSYHRAVSWLNNPNLEPEDVIMYLAIENNLMIGYRCILPDKIGAVKFGWLSGNWVNPARRREGIATRLFEEAMKDWDNKLMYTNYAYPSHAVYNKTGYFKLYNELSGIRAYLRFDMADLLSPKNRFFARMKPLLKLLDIILNFFNDLRLKFHRGRFKLPFAGLQLASEIDKQIEHFIFSGITGWSSFREPRNLNWIIRFPWVIEQQMINNYNQKYHFSSIARQYENLNIKLFDQNERLILYMMLVIIDKKMTIPYTFFDKKHAGKAADMILSFMYDKQINYVTLFNPELVSEFRRRKFPFLLKRKMTRKYFATKDLINLMLPPNDVFIQDGDGDVVFT